MRDLGEVGEYRCDGVGVGSVSSWATGIYVISKCEGTATYVLTGVQRVVDYTPSVEKRDLRALLAACRCWRVPAHGQCDSAPPPPLHPSQIPRHCSTSCCTSRRFQGTPAPQHGQSFLAALAAHPLQKPTRLLRAALAAVAADCSTHSPRFAQALLAGWLSPRAADCTSSGDLASHWTRRSSGETPAR